MSSLTLPTGHARLPEHLLEGFQVCQHCHSPGATRWCADCHDSTLGDTRTWYCSKECQTQHWTKHKSSCRSCRRLVRAVGIFATFWDDFERCTFVRDLRFVEERPQGVIHMAWGGVTNDIINPGVWTGESIYHTFPGQLVPASAGRVAERAVLYDSACGNVSVAGLPIVKTLLQPVCAGIQDAWVTPKERAITTCISNAPVIVVSTAISHNVLCVKLATGQEYTIDLTGAQYGWHEQLYTWQTYLQHRGQDGERKPLGIVKETFERGVVSVVGGPAKLIHDMKCQISAEMAGRMKVFFARKGTGPRAFMSLPPGEFSLQRAELLGDLKHQLREVIHDLTVRRGIGRMYVYMDELGPSVYIVQSEEEAEKLKKIWFTKQQYQRKQGRTMELAREWMNRVKRHQCQDIAGSADLRDPTLSIYLRGGVPYWGKVA